MSVDKSPVIGSIQVPSQKIKLPIYHGTSDEVLQVAAGHLEGSSLPIGGPSTHSVITGHRGLPSAILFDNIVNLTIGDPFVVTVLGEKFTYEVEQIRTVLPNEVNNLEIQEGRDLCTLVTCTPYGINTHRILVTGHRIENLPDEYLNARDNASVINPTIIAAIMAAVILLILFLWLTLKPSGNKKGGNKKKINSASDTTSESKTSNGTAEENDSDSEPIIEEGNSSTVSDLEVDDLLEGLKDLKPEKPYEAQARELYEELEKKNSRKSG